MTDLLVTVPVTRSYVEYLLAKGCNTGLEQASKYVLEQSTIGMSTSAIAEGLLRLRYSPDELTRLETGP